MFEYLFIIFLFVLSPAESKINFQASEFPNADHEVIDSTSIQILYKVVAGEVIYESKSLKRRVESAQMVQLSDIEDIYQQPNVLLVSSILSQRDWDWLFSTKVTDNDYEAFLQSVAMFPAFCNEYKPIRDNLQNQELACRRELATLFAHMMYETSIKDIAQNTAFEFLKEENCINFPDLFPLECNYRTDSQDFQWVDSQQYYGRGTMHLRWNTQYGRFSKAFYDDQYDGKQVLLENPNLLLDIAPTFIPALWHYMTPHFPKPSAHDVITGLFEPNQYDQRMYVSNDFGTTIAIMAQDEPNEATLECLKTNQIESQEALLRAELFDFTLNSLNLGPESETGCARTIMTYGGAGEVNSFWFMKQGHPGQCELVHYKTQFSIYNAEDYKRCVCWFWGTKEGSCPQDEVDPKCQWSQQNTQEFALIVPFFSANSPTYEVNLVEELFPKLTFPSCGSSLVSFYALDLIIDHQGRTAIDSSFRNDYKNDNDSLLSPSETPSDMHIATTLGQQSLVFGQALQNQVLAGTYDSATHGQDPWVFLVRACVDRRASFSNIDCDDGAYRVYVKFVEVCTTSDADLYPECSKDSLAPLDPPTPIIDPSGLPDQNEQDEQQKDDPIEIKNFIPIFSDFDPQEVHEVQQGEEKEVQLPKLIDQDAQDTVEVIVNVSNERAKWIKFDAVTKIFYLRPTVETPLGIHRQLVILDDQKNRSIDYYINFWVEEKSQEQQNDNDDKDDESNDDHQANPDPSSPNENEKAKNIKDSNENDSYEQMIKRSFQSFRNEYEQKARENLSFEDLQAAKEPSSIIEYINEIGEISLRFSQEIYMKELFDSIEVFSSEDFMDKNNQFRRNLSTRTDDLSLLIKTEIIRGSDDKSAEKGMLGHKASLISFNQRSIDLKLEFENPLYVSMGDENDILEVTFLEPDVFIARETGLSLAQKSTILRRPIPKQFPDEASYQMAVLAGSTVQVAANTAFLSQFGVTICLAVSLKSMWNLMHVMQVLAYLRLAADWPANTNMLLQSMYNAITLENVINKISDSFLSNFGEEVFEEEQSEQDVQLEKSNIFSKNLALSLGIFGIALIILILALIIYYFTKLVSSRVKCCNKLMQKIKAKLFYSVWIRYMIESNLKVTHNCIFMLYISGSFGESIENTVATAVQIVILTLIVAWPIFLILFLYNKRNKVNDQTFKAKVVSMYSGIKTKKFQALMYTAIFCLRRLLLVCILLVLQDHRIWLILAYQALQSFYFWYMVLVKPHEQPIHNKLEWFNELCIICLQYTMYLFISQGLGVDPEIQWSVGSGVMSFIGMIFMVNIVALIYLTVRKIIFWCRVRKIRKLAKLRQQQANERRNSNKIKPIETEQNELNQARKLTVIAEEVHKDQSLLDPTQLQSLLAPNLSINICGASVNRIQLNSIASTEQLDSSSSESIASLGGRAKYNPLPLARMKTDSQINIMDQIQIQLSENCSIHDLEDTQRAQVPLHPNSNHLLDYDRSNGHRGGKSYKLFASRNAKTMEFERTGLNSISYGLEQDNTPSVQESIPDDYSGRCMLDRKNSISTQYTPCKAPVTSAEYLIPARGRAASTALFAMPPAQNGQADVPHWTRVVAQSNASVLGNHSSFNHGDHEPQSFSNIEQNYARNLRENDPIQRRNTLYANPMLAPNLQVSAGSNRLSGFYEPNLQFSQNRVRKSTITGLNQRNSLSNSHLQQHPAVSSRFQQSLSSKNSHGSYNNPLRSSALVISRQDLVVRELPGESTSRATINNSTSSYAARPHKINEEQALGRFSHDSERGGGENFSPQSQIIITEGEESPPYQSNNGLGN